MPKEGNAKLSPEEAYAEAERRIQLARDRGARQLNLSRLPLEFLPPALFSLFDLEILYLSNSGISAISPEIGQLNSLQRLYLHGNRLKSLPAEFGQLASLLALNLSRNQLQSLPPEIGQLASLRNLFLHSNQLQSLPAEFGQLASLHFLSLDNNPLTELPKNIVSEGKSAILAYLRGLLAEEERLWVSKLVVVGQGGVGKTCLLDALLDRPYDDNSETTHGIQIKPVKLAHPQEDGVTMQLNAWDFGGQEIYHATHQFFLTNRALFLFVWNARGDWEQGKPDYWLDMIHARAPEAKIILVATHIDERSPDLPLAAYQAKFPNIVGSIGFSNKQRDNLAELKALIQQHAAELPLMGVRWPKSWADAATAVRDQAEKTKHLPTRDFCELLSGCDLAEQDIGIVSRHLHHLGEILHYPNDPSLKHIVILKPDWVSDYISRVLESEKVSADGGVLTNEEMREQWKELDPSLQNVFLELMEQYDLSYKILDAQDRSLVVEALSQDRPDYSKVWDEPVKRDHMREIRIKYRLGSMQPGIPTWFIARCHRFTTGMHWRNGVVFADSAEHRHTALIEANPATAEIDFAARGPAPWQLFAVLRDGLEDTLKRYPGLDIKKSIPCPGHDGDTEPCGYLFDYDILLRRLDAGKKNAECQEKFEEFPITELLFGIGGPTGNEAVMGRIDELEDSVKGHIDEEAEKNRDMLRELRVLALDNHKRQFNALQRLEESHCPSLFAICPHGKKETLFTEKMELHLLCEHPHQSHFARPENPYLIAEPKRWLRSMLPIIKTGAQILRYAVPVAGPWVKMASEDMEELLRNCVAQMKLVAEDAEKIAEAKWGEFSIPPGRHGAEGAQLRELRELLDSCEEAKAESPGWQGLQKVLTPEGQWLWLCDHHADEFRKS